MVNKFSTIKERVIQFVDYKRIKKELFFKNIGMSSANFRGKAQETPLNSTTIENIFTKYPEISLEWLITGNGEMITENSDKHSETTTKNVNRETDLQELVDSLKRENQLLREMNEMLKKK